VEIGRVSNAELILHALDELLDAPAELTLYGRAALQLGFANPPAEYARSRDVDVVLWFGQAEMLLNAGNFWNAVEAVNARFADQELYVSHFFEEDQVVLRPDWRRHRVAIAGNWRQVSLFRLGDLDLLLTKLMRNDPIDRQDADFIIARGRLTSEAIRQALREARVPDVPEIREQFELCSRRFL
jgi:hypothetical protein